MLTANFDERQILPPPNPHCTQPYLSWCPIHVTKMCYKSFSVVKQKGTFLFTFQNSIWQVNAMVRNGEKVVHKMQ